MKVLEIWEWDNFKDESKLKKYYEHGETYGPYVQKKCEELNIKASGWSNGTGHMVRIAEYESMEDYVKLWSDEEYQRKFTKFCRLVKNMCKRVFRSSLSVPPD